MYRSHLFSPSARLLPYTDIASHCMDTAFKTISNFIITPNHPSQRTRMKPRAAERKRYASYSPAFDWRLK